MIPKSFNPDQPQTAAGCYLYEPGGSVHQLQTPASNTEGAEPFMIVTGCNVDFDEEPAPIRPVRTDSSKVRARKMKALKARLNRNRWRRAVPAVVFPPTPRPC